MNSHSPTNINNHQQLKQAIEQLKQQISLQEESIGNKVHQVPSELLKSASGAILPAIINTATLSGVWNIMKLVPVAQSLFSLFRKKTGK
ncbi:MAG: hypothetical protein FD136_1803 [Chitinophagaceae bacterium]|nr:MAG: hypothetical protein FD183_292 [Chitinophagaceae bacterium]TXT29684.1 MAG: hypothetical protein FD136_1803 [Chitinophagaceae bacterium]